MSDKTSPASLEVENGIPVEVQDYYPSVALRLLNKIIKLAPEKVVLYGFSDNMKWLLRLLQEHKVFPVLTDWRDKYIGYDCGGHDLISVDTLIDHSGTLLVICVEEINDLKDAVSYLYHLAKNDIKVIYDRSTSMPRSAKSNHTKVYRKELQPGLYQ